MSNNLNTLMCTLHNFPVLKLDLVIKSLLLDYILALGKKYAYALRASCFYIEINIFEHFSLATNNETCAIQGSSLYIQGFP